MFVSFIMQAPTHTLLSREPAGMIHSLATDISANPFNKSARSGCLAHQLQRQPAITAS
jgi:hypothetical protein